MTITRKNLRFVAALFSFLFFAACSNKDETFSNIGTSRECLFHNYNESYSSNCKTLRLQKVDREGRSMVPDNSDFSGI